MASLEPLLKPRSVAVIGAGRRPGSIGRTILLNIRDAGFAGALYAVSPRGGDIDGHSVRAVGRRAARGARPGGGGGAGGAGRRGGPGVREAGRQVAGGDHRRADGGAGVRPAGRPARRYRHAAGRARTASASRCQASGLDATSAARHPRPGTRRPGRAVRRGRRRRCWSSSPGWASGSPPSPRSATSWTCPAPTCCSGGRRTDATELAVLYLESFGNPRRFARTARRVSATMPVLTVHAGRSAPGQRAAASHTAAAAAPLITRQALFEQAGIIATDQLRRTARRGRAAGVPAGPGGHRGRASCPTAAARACSPPTPARRPAWPWPRPAAQARSRLRDVLPAAASVAGPVDTTAAVSPRGLRARRCARSPPRRASPR